MTIYTDDEITFKLNVMILRDNVNKFETLGHLGNQELLNKIKYY